MVDALGCAIGTVYRICRLAQLVMRGKGSIGFMEVVESRKRAIMAIAILVHPPFEDDKIRRRTPCRSVSH